MDTAPCAGSCRWCASCRRAPASCSLAALLILHTLRPATPQPPVERARRDTWRMPAPAAFRPVAWCLSLKLGMILLRGYLIPSALLLVVKAVRLGRG